MEKDSGPYYLTSMGKARPRQKSLICTAIEGTLEVDSLATPIGKRLVQSEIIVVFSLLLLIIFGYFAWVSYGNYTSGTYFSVSEFWNFHWMIVDMFLAGVFSTLFVVFLGFWASMKMRYLEIERQQLREEIKKELEMEKQKKEGNT